MVLPSGRTLLLMEPDTEGRLAAFLARHGEGLAAVYLAGSGLAVARAGSGRPGLTALGRSGRLLAGGRPGDPGIVLLD